MPGHTWTRYHMCAQDRCPDVYWACSHTHLGYAGTRSHMYALGPTPTHAAPRHFSYMNTGHMPRRTATHVHRTCARTLPPLCTGHRCALKDMHAFRGTALRGACLAPEQALQAGEQPYHLLHVVFLQ